MARKRKEQAQSESWKLTIDCTRAEAEAFEADESALALIDPMPVVTAQEPDTQQPDAWQLEIFLEQRPDTALIRAVTGLLPSSAGTKPKVEKLAAQDWVTLSQQGLEPVEAGRFFVRHDAAEPIPPGRTDFLIPAGRAFGTGTHETTAGCLEMLDRLKRIGGHYANICDVGTGTGLLAFAAMRLWPAALATASDIDPVSVEVTAENAVLNAIAPGIEPGRLALFEAAGVDNAGLRARGPFDLVIANILAGPLIALAPSLCAQLSERGTLILAGLLDTQADRVARAYRAQNMRLVDRIDNGEWPTLRFRKRSEWGRPRVRRWDKSDNGESPGYGSW